MTEEQADDIIAKLDGIALNTMTREQGDKIIELLKQIAAELAEFHTESLKP